MQIAFSNALHCLVQTHLNVVIEVIIFNAKRSAGCLRAANLAMKSICAADSGNVISEVGCADVMIIELVADKIIQCFVQGMMNYWILYTSMFERADHVGKAQMPWVFSDMHLSIQCTRNWVAQLWGPAMIFVRTK